jgi:hypothetical protein
VFGRDGELGSEIDDDKMVALISDGDDEPEWPSRRAEVAGDNNDGAE